jgi:hypothetical protein
MCGMAFLEHMPSHTLMGPQLVDVEGIRDATSSCSVLVLSRQSYVSFQCEWGVLLDTGVRSTSCIRSMWAPALARCGTGVLS